MPLKDLDARRQYLRRYNQKHRERDRSKRYAAQRRHLVKLRKDVLSILGGTCVQCGTVDNRVLQVDHITGGGTKEHAQIGWRRIMMKIRDGNTRDYQLLCAN